jgi:hypothetical protein
VDDAGARGDHLEVVEGGLTPAQELVALAVALVLELHVLLERVEASGHVDHHGVVDDHLGGGERVDALGVAAEVGDGLAHGGEVDDAGDAGEVLHDHAGGRELDLGVRLGAGVPGTERAHVVRGDVRTVLGAQQVLQQDLQAVGELLMAVDGVDAIDLVLGVADGEGLPRAERVHGAHGAQLLRLWGVVPS